MDLNDLGLELSPRITGGVAIPLAVDFVRNLEVEDLELLNAPRPATEKQSLQRITARHHALARHIATGLKNAEAAAIMGYSPITVNILMTDPTFKELVVAYQSNLEREQRDNFARLVDMTADAVDLVMDKMENEPEKITVGQALEIVKVGADRTGLGPSSTTATVNFNVNLAERMKRAREAARGKTIDVLPNEAAE